MSCAGIRPRRPAARHVDEYVAYQLQLLVKKKKNQTTKQTNKTNRKQKAESRKQKARCNVHARNPTAPFRQLRSLKPRPQSQYQQWKVDDNDNQHACRMQASFSSSIALLLAYRPAVLRLGISVSSLLAIAITTRYHWRSCRRGMNHRRLLLPFSPSSSSVSARF